MRACIIIILCVIIKGVLGEERKGKSDLPVDNGDVDQHQLSELVEIEAFLKVFSEMRVLLITHLSILLGPCLT